MELRHLRYLLAVAEHHHFGRAAESLGIKQPPLSQQIQALEAELGVQLLVRSRHGSELTAAGELFAQHARAALASVEVASTEAQRAHRGDTGRLVIGFLPSAIDSLLPKVLAAFSSKWPHVALEPVEYMLTTDAVAALRQGTADWVVGRPPFTTGGIEDELSALPLLSDQINVVLPRSHPLAGRQHIEPSSLRGDRFILTPLEERPPRYWHMVCEAAGFEPTVAARVRGTHTVVGMVSANVGLGLIPQSARIAERADVAFVPTRPPVLAPPLTLVWRAGDEREISRKFLGIVRDVLRVTDKVMTGHALNRAYLTTLRKQVTQVRS